MAGGQQASVAVLKTFTRFVAGAGVHACSWGRYIEVIDRGSTSCALGGLVWCCLETWTGCGCLYTFGYRSRLRQKYELPPEPCGDFLVDCCCPACSICQVTRELKYRGVDTVLGWEGVRAAYDSPGQPPQPAYEEVQLKPGPPVFDDHQGGPPRQAPDQQVMGGHAGHGPPPPAGYGAPNPHSGHPGY